VQLRDEFRFRACAIDEIIGARFEGLHAKGGIGFAGSNNQDGKAMVICAGLEGAGEFNAVKARHVEIEDRTVRRLLLNELEGLLGGTGKLDLCVWEVFADPGAG